MNKLAGQADLLWCAHMPTVSEALSMGFGMTHGIAWPEFVCNLRIFRKLSVLSCHMSKC